MQGEVTPDGAARRGACAAGAARHRAARAAQVQPPNGRLVSALVRPLLWLAVFAAGLRNVFGVAIVEPYDTYIPYDVYIAPGLVGMVLLFNGMQSSLAMVYDREMGLMRMLLTAPLPRPWMLFCKLVATAVLSLAQAAAFVIVAALLGTALPIIGAQTPHVLAAAIGSALMLGALGLLLQRPHQAARELRRHDELRHLPDVLSVDRALPFVEAGGVGRGAGSIRWRGSTRSRMPSSGCASRCTARTRASRRGSCWARSWSASRSPAGATTRNAASARWPSAAAGVLRETSASTCFSGGRCTRRTSGCHCHAPPLGTRSRCCLPRSRRRSTLFRRARSRCGCRGLRAARPT